MLAKKVKSHLSLNFLKISFLAFGSIQCDECGMIYYPGKEEDEIIHTKFHKQLHEKCLDFHVRLN